MIVVAIVAILSAIAIPMYNDYTARAHLGEALVLLGGLKAPVAEQFSSDSSALSCSIPEDAVVSGSYVASIVATDASPCVITAKMKSSGVQNKVSGATVSITYTPALASWSCTTSAPSEVAPKSCPHN